MKAAGYVVALSMLFHSVAFAQALQPDEAARQQASAHFRRGVELFQEEAFRAALAEFQRANELAPDYRLLYNIGQTKLELHDYLGAAQSYERYLSTGYLDISPERRGEVEEALTALRERVSSVKIVVNRKDAEVFIDDVKVGTSPIAAPVLVNVGGHRVTARTSYGSTDTEVIDVAGGDMANVTLELAAPTPAIVMNKKRVWNTSERTAVATWSAAGGLAIGAVVTGIMAGGAKSDLDKMIETAGSSRKSMENKRDSAHTLAVTTDVLIATSAAAAVAGTLTWILGHEKSNDRKVEDKRPLANVRVNMGLSSVGVTGQF
jgi:hypothetical protein